MSEDNQAQKPPQPAVKQTAPPQQGRPMPQAQTRPPLQNVDRVRHSNWEPTRFTADGLDRAADRRSPETKGETDS